MPFIQLGPVMIHYATSGDPARTALVFSNSLGTDLRIWDRVAPAFEDDFFVVRYDKRGHGLSDAPPAPYTLDEHVTDVIALMDALGISRAVICGDSVGGLIAQGVAARDVDRVQALVLCDTAARIGDDDTWNTRIEAVGAGGIEAVADATMQRWFAPAYREANAVEVAGWRNMLVRTPLAGFVGTMMAIRDADYTEDTAGLSIPALVVVGEEDGSTPPDVVRRLSDLIDESDFHVIGGAGHLPCIDSSDKLVRMMRAFLRRNALVGG